MYFYHREYRYIKGCIFYVSTIIIYREVREFYEILVINIRLYLLVPYSQLFIII